jgi:hypothetical protein
MPREKFAHRTKFTFPPFILVTRMSPFVMSKIAKKNTSGLPVLEMTAVFCQSSPTNISEL